MYIKYKNIDELYNIKDVTDEYILVKRNKSQERIYIFKVKPLVLLDMSVETKQDIINIYMQFLKELTLPFEICISNKKIDVDNYINTYFLNKSKQINEDIFKAYVDELRTELKKDDIYETVIYIIVSENVKKQSEINDIKRTLVKLEKIGCKVEQIVNKDKLKEVLFNAINKE